jgi:hypothetical protein
MHSIPSSVPSQDPSPERCSLDRSLGHLRTSPPTRLDSIGTIQQPKLRTSCVVGWLRKPGRCIPVSCGRWECEKCNREKGKKAWARIQNSPAIRFTRLLTLPFQITATRGWKEAIADSGKVLNAFLTSLRRVIPGFQYLWVREVGRKSNMVHFHMLLDRYLPKSLLSRLWARAGGGYIVDIGLIRSTASYVLKYLAKSPSLPLEVTIALRGLRRYSCARGLLLPPISSMLWQGCTFSRVFPPLALRAKVVAVLDGVYYYIEEGGEGGHIRQGDSG